MQAAPVTHQLHTRLREQLRVSLAEVPGGRVPSERALAKEFGVSTITVSKALHELQQEGFLERIPGKGTFLSDKDFFLGKSPEVDLAPSSPISRAIVAEAAINALIFVQLLSYEQGVDRSSEFWPHRILSNLERDIQGQGGRTTIAVCHEYTEAQIREACLEAANSGINTIFFIQDERNPSLELWLEQLAQLTVHAAANRRTPPAVIQISLSGAVGDYFDTVAFDGGWGSYLATHHLLELGHRRIAFLAPTVAGNWLTARIRGFHRALRAFEIEVPREDQEFGVLRIESDPPGPEMWQHMGARAARVFDDPSITAVVAANDQMASKFIATARELGRAVPGSLSVVGYDDWFSSSMEGLTTVHPPIDGLAASALSLAKKRLAETSRQEHVSLVLKPTLIVRTSTTSPSVTA